MPKLRVAGYAATILVFTIICLPVSRGFPSAVPTATPSGVRLSMAFAAASKSAHPRIAARILSEEGKFCSPVGRAATGTHAVGQLRWIAIATRSGSPRQILAGHSVTSDFQRFRQDHKICLAAAIIT
jgi:hypothetical protein